jgi:hypothetical protein
MTQENFTLTDENRFEVLELVSIGLPGLGVWWHTEDLDQPTAKGAIFRCYGNEPEQELGFLLVADVSDDPTEPDVMEFTQSDAAAFDEFLRQGIPEIFARDGRRLVEWKGSALMEKLPRFDGQVLVTAYIGWDQGRERHYLDLRMSLRGRKVILAGCFDVEREGDLADAIVWSISNARPVDRRLQ